MSKRTFQKILGSTVIFGLLLSYQNCLAPKGKIKDVSEIATAAAGNDIQLFPEPKREKLVSQEEVLTFIDTHEVPSSSQDILGQDLSQDEIRLKQEFAADSRNLNFQAVLRLRNAPREMGQLKIGQRILSRGSDFEIFSNLIFIKQDMLPQDQDVIEAHYMILESEEQ